MPCANRFRLSFYATAAVIALLFAQDAVAMPMFARKYHLSCATCHDAPNIPRLNATGYKFRRAGFRMPENIGEDDPDFDLGNTMSGRVLVEANATSTVDHGGRTTAGGFSGELSVWPLTGSFQKYFASQIELAFSPKGFSIENAYLRGVFGKKDFWFDVRAGIVHPIEGFGASDKPLGISAPLFESLGANKLQDTLMRLAEPSRLGFGAGVEWKNTSLSVQAVNGLVTVVKDGGVDVEGTLPTKGWSTDVIVFANQILGKRSGFSLYYARGHTQPPIDPDGFLAGRSDATWTNPYDRFAGFASVGISRFTMLAGGGIGLDDSRDPDTKKQTRFVSGGCFVEIDTSLVADASTFVRGDYFKPAVDVPANDVGTTTVGATWHHEWIYVTSEVSLGLTSTPTGYIESTTGLARIAAVY